MLEVREFKIRDLQGLAPSALPALAQQMLAPVLEPGQHIQERKQRIETHARDIKFKDAKLEKATFEQEWRKTGRLLAKTRSMNAEPRRMLEETLARGPS
jgi:transposase